METINIIFNSFVATLGAFLSFMLTKFLKQNGMVLNRMDERFKMIGQKMDEGFRRMDERFIKLETTIAKLIVTENERTRKAILRKLK